MKFGVIIFPGTNCDHDCYYGLKHILNQEVNFIWHKETRIKPGYDCLILPGGFSYGDYLRTGAIARFSPLMEAVREFARAGGMVMGICNGFQILLEANLLPGAMLKNKGLRFICKNIPLRLENSQLPYTRAIRKGKVLHLPIRHLEGNYYADRKTFAELKKNNQVVLRYCSEQGDILSAVNPNGSLDNIAGICNKEGNVFGLMPHPECALESILGSEDGRLFFESLLRWKMEGVNIQ